MKKETDFKLARLRKAVSAIVFTDEGKFLLFSGKGWPRDSWCFPQGGVQKGESFFRALDRELYEELGTSKYEILGKSSFEHSYLFPQDLALKKGCEGQYQTIWFARFLGDEDDLSVDEDEIASFKWVDESEVISLLSFPEQKEIFSQALEELSHLRDEGIF